MYCIAFIDNEIVVDFLQVTLNVELSNFRLGLLRRSSPVVSIASSSS